MNISETIFARKSVRTYGPQPVSRALLDEILGKFDANQRLTNLSVRLIPMKPELVIGAMTGVIGSYGSVKNAPLWIIGVSKEGAHYQENFGYRMEQFILDCTAADLGTCWIGGFFKLSVLENSVPKKADEKIVCITPLGYEAKRRVAERAMRALGGLNTRKPLAERVFYQSWGRPSAEYLSTHETITSIMEHARRAPSASNVQPCHYIIDDNRIIVAVLTSLQKKYPIIVSKDRGMNLNFQPIDAGIAMAHIHLAAQHFGLSGVWSLDDDRDKLRKQYGFPDESSIIGCYNF